MQRQRRVYGNALLRGRKGGAPKSTFEGGQKYMAKGTEDILSLGGDFAKSGSRG
jgi:hypothetical protein